MFSSRNSDAHKGDFGRVLLIGGSRGMAGSIALSSIAALKTGSGLVSAAVPDRCLETVASFHPGLMTIPLTDTADGQFGIQDSLDGSLRKFNADVIACGPGMRTGNGAVQIVEWLLHKTQVPRVLDADALNVIAEQKLFDSPALPRDQSQLVITPHPGELSRLTGISPKEREAQIAAASALTERLGLTVVVKGGPTVIVGRDSSGSTRRHVNASGNPGMATAGSGDLLTGIIASLLGQGFTVWKAVELGVFLHGKAGDIAAAKHSQASMTCVEILDNLRSAILAETET